jgi:carbamoyl-phosphate synthase large subunit
MIQFIINTPSGKIPREDEVRIRSAALGEKIPIITTIRAAWASARGIRSLQKGGMAVKSLQEYHESHASNSVTVRRDLPA